MAIDDGKGQTRVFELFGFLYGLMASVVFAGAHRNDREGKPHSPLLLALGYVLVGSLATLAIGLVLSAALGLDPLGIAAAAAA